MTGRLRIERWGGPGTLQGRVRLVEPGAFTKVSALGVEEQRVNVLVDITSDPQQWRALGDGYRVSLQFVTLALDKALREGRARLTPVDVGGRNGSTAWIRSGLESGTTVIVYPPSTVSDRVRVKPRKV